MTFAYDGKLIKRYGITFLENCEVEEICHFMNV